MTVSPAVFKLVTFRFHNLVFIQNQGLETVVEVVSIRDGVSVWFFLEVHDPFLGRLALVLLLERIGGSSFDSFTVVLFSEQLSSLEEHKLWHLLVEDQTLEGPALFGLVVDHAEQEHVGDKVAELYAYRDHQVKLVVVGGWVCC